THPLPSHLYTLSLHDALPILLDHTSFCTARTRCAIQLAKDLDCHLVGLAPTDLIDLPTTPKAASSINECAALVWDALRDQAERRSEEHTSELQSLRHLVCRLL